MKYRITREEYKKQKTTKPLDKVISDTFGPKGWASFVNQYFVDFKLVHTQALVNILQKLTIHDRYSEEHELTMPKPPTYDRALYLKELSEYCGAEIADKEIEELIRNREFLLNRGKIILKLREELSTREHVPNKKQNQIIRKLKAQGRYVID